MYFICHNMFNQMRSNSFCQILSCVWCELKFSRTNHFFVYTTIAMMMYPTDQVLSNFQNNVHTHKFKWFVVPFNYLLINFICESRNFQYCACFTKECLMMLWLGCVLEVVSKMQHPIKCDNISSWFILSYTLKKMLDFVTPLIDNTFQVKVQVKIWMWLICEMVYYT